MIRLFKSAVAALWAGFLGLVILAGALSAAAQLTAPLLGGLRDDVEHHLEQALRAPVRIERLAVRWRGLGPELVARHVAVLDVGGEAGLEVDEVTVALSLGDAVRRWRLWPTRIGITGVRLRLIRHADGTLAVEGLRGGGADSAAADGGERGHLTALLAPERLRITNAEILLEDRMRGRPPLAFRNGILLVRNDGARHQINAALDLPDERGTRLSFAADLHARPDRLEDWRGEIYLDVTGAQAAPLVAPLLPPHYRLDQATADVRVWTGWERGEPVWAEGRATVADLQLRGREPARTLRLDRLSGRFRWDRRADGGLLRLTEVAVGPTDPRAEPAEWAVAWRRGGAQAPGLRLHASAVTLSDVAAVLALRPPGGEELDRVLRAGPTGSLRDLDVSMVQRGSGDWWWRAGAELRDGRIAPLGRAPGLEGIDLRMDAAADGGRVLLDAGAAAFSLPGVLREPVAVNRLKGEVGWRRAADGGWIVEAPGVELSNPDLHTHTRLRLGLPADGRLAIDLESDFRDGVLTRVPAYLPVGVMEPDAIKWLDAAFHGGKLTSGRAVLRGPLADAPFDQTRNGRFEVTLGVEAGDLEFAPGWPRIRDIDATVRFHGDSLEVRAEHGRIFDSRVVQAAARIDSLSREAPVRIDGVVAGPLADCLRALRETPLSQDFGAAAEGVQAEGESRLTLDLSIAIDGVGKDQVKGTLGLEGARVTHPALPMPLTSVRGNIGFDTASVKASGLTAQFGEIPLTVDVAAAKDGAALVSVRTPTRIDVATLAPLLPAKPAWLRGATTFTGVVTLPPLHRPGPVGLRVESDLAGVALDLPPPFAKPAETRRAFDLEAGFPDNAPMPLRMRYGADLDLAMQVERPTATVQRAELRLGGEKAQLPDSDVLRLRGRLPSADLPAVTSWFQSHPPQLGLPVDAAIVVERLGLGADGALTGVHLNFQQGRAGWQGDVRSAELEGRFSWPASVDSGPAVIDLQRLHVRSGDTDGPAAPAIPPSRQDPRELPALNLSIAGMRLNGRDLGSLRGSASRVPRGLEVKDMVLEGPSGRLNVSGSWLQDPPGPVTRVAYQLDTPDFGNVVLALGFADMIERGPATLSGEHSWPGAPHDFARGRGAGKLSLSMGPGQFIELSPGVGRLMGLLNITALQRRLTLDFRDLFQKGMGFDSVTGSFDMHDGSLYTEDLTIRSPSSLIEISGRTGVLARDFDQLVSVTPSLQSALPIAGTVVGGPAVGVAMLVVQGLVGKQFDKIGRVRYSVRGSWDDPKVEVIERTAVGGGSGPVPPRPEDRAANGAGPTGVRRPAGQPSPETPPPSAPPRPATPTPMPAFH